MVGMVERREVDSEEEETEDSETEEEEEVDDGDNEEEEETVEEEEFRSDEEEVEDGNESEEEKGAVKEKEKQIKGNIIKLKEKYALKHKEDDRKKKVRILSRAGKVRSKKCGRSYNVEDVDTGDVHWLKLDEWEVKREEVNEEGLWGEKEEDNEERKRKMRANEDELRSWKQNKCIRKLREKRSMDYQQDGY